MDAFNPHYTSNFKFAGCFRRLLLYSGLGACRCVASENRLVLFSKCSEKSLLLLKCSIPGGPETKVFEYSSGGAFGELALLHGERRHASVRATEDCVCWALDRNTFRKIMMSTGRHTMEERTAFISRIKLLENLSTFERFRIAEARIHFSIPTSTAAA